MTEHTSIFLTHGEQIIMEGMRKASAEASNLRLEIERLRAALSPFEDVAAEGSDDFADDEPVMVHFGRTTFFGLTLGDLRRASAALNIQQRAEK